ncbi:class I SAM-dependent methyltransferase [Chitinilyticum piscinae]|uniref:Class I SAM-dependent methyltransferase n=1 Tax=Chitinilyticum piscinae TaxID=2866724 RepID=A0A8J7K7Z7_9NEIS|nr:class I SAM-dependent methyltransferase [Chitinilyticum piscinae]MBE9608818.1 class I SAM-dependent methyltransferase [Chitinilyticum piscinae]
MQEWDEKMKTDGVREHELGFFQLDPIPSGGELTSFYQSRYYDLLRQGGRAPEIRKLLDAQGERQDELDWLQATLYQDVADAIRQHVPQGGRLLDVGCGSGDLLEYLSSQGFSASGIEPSTDATAIAVSRGLKVNTATLENWAALPENKASYDAITLMNVLEHVPDPLQVLECLHSLLRPSGVLCFRVPNDFTPLQAAAENMGISRKQWWVAKPDHINYFSEESARASCATVGLEVVDVTADFPMEFFLLMGMNYIDEPQLGKQVHGMRRSLEMAMPTPMRQTLYRAFAEMGMGRNIMVTAKRQ